ncbi:MAG: exosortase/archaeosortase family protein [Planctomycetes bacterium]|nr:exosortase/archaeosortase family protein [Planctomycetota bacterium]
MLTVLAAFGVVILCAHNLGPWLLLRWDEEAGAFSHGPLVVAAAIPWLLFAARRVPRSRGILAAVFLALPAAFFLWMLAARGSGSAGALGAWLALLALIAAGGGTAMLRHLFPALGFLFFALPWPLKLVDDLSLPLRDFALQGGLLLAPDGVVREGEGARLIVGAGRLLVGEVCSGLRSSVTLLAVAWMFAALTKLKPWRFAVCVLAAPLCAVFANALRVAFLIHVAQRSGIDAAAPGTLAHDGSGIVAFIVASALMLWTTRGGSASSTGAVPTGAPPARIWFVSLAAVFVIAAFFVGVAAPVSVPADLGRLLPKELRLESVQVLTSREVELEPSTLKLLQPRGWVYRTFGVGDRFSICVVYGAGPEVRIHAPEICYRGNGYEVQGMQMLPCPDDFPESPVGLHEVLLLKGTEKRLSWSFYRAGRQSMAEYNSFAWRVLLRPSEPQALVLLSTPLVAGDVDRARQELRWFLREMAPGLSAILAQL